MQLQHEVQIAQLNRVGYSVGISLCFFGWYFLKSVCHWINLRTAVRLRNGILAAVYKKTMKSLVNYRISPHQIMSLVNEESEIIFSFVENGAIIFGTVIGVVLCLLSALILLGAAGIWPLFGIFGLFVLIVGFILYIYFIWFLIFFF